MQAAFEGDLVSEDEYLAAEQESETRHEYLGGLVYAMAGETRAHNQIVGNLYLATRRHLGSRPCKTHMSDIRVNFKLRGDDYYYYPDIVVTCDARDTNARFVQFPKLMVEVLSESTERIDRREKLFAYTTLESLEEYALVSQTNREVTLFRRRTDWRSETISGEDARLTFESLKLELPFTAIYEGL